MKLITILSVLALSASVQAETTLTMTGVHNCCKSCVNGITKAAAAIKDVTVTAEGETVTIVSKKKGDAKKAAEAIIAGGYYGKFEGQDEVKSSPNADAKITKATVSGVHLCCKKCVTAAEGAVKSVSGVSKYEIVSKAESFTVEGEFSKSDLVAALNAAGFAGDIK